MQRVTLVRYSAKAEHAEANEQLSRAVFAELRDRRPAGLAYALLRDGADFVHVFVNMVEADSEVLVGLPSFKAFSAEGPARFVAAPEIVRIDADLVDSYGIR